jgi:N,N'-diacetyllegionaminate synthase
MVEEKNKILVCAEIGHNHMGYMRHAKLLIEEAKSCGADVAKFQAYNADKIKKPWESRYFELKFSEHTFEEFKELKEHCDKVGIEFMASAFDLEHLEWLEKLGVKRHKLASRSIYDTELIKAMEKTGKPIIASLGKIDQRGIPKIKNCQYLYCVSEYPAYISGLPEFGKTYQGFSDHTIGTYWCREAVKRGATIIEKHFTLSKDLPGHDQKGSADPTDLKDLVTYIRQKERGIQY